MPYRNSRGQYTTRRAAERNPRTTAKEKSGKSGWKGVVHQSTITGRIVRPTTAKRHPDTTVTHDRRS